MLEREEVTKLVDQARSDDVDAWEALYRNFYPVLSTYARRRLATDHQADDAVSETFARAIDNLDRFQPDRSGFGGWLFGILRNVVLEAYRAGARHRPADSSRLADTAAVDSDPSTSVVAASDAAAVRAAFARLDPDEQELLELRVIGGLGSRDVAAATGRGAGAVRMAQSRALSKLRSMLRGAT